MRVLVTGGAGFIGSHTVEALLGRGAGVTVLDNLSSGVRENIPRSARFVEGDIRSAESVERAVAGAEAIIHLAAFASVPDSFARPRQCMTINVEGTIRVLEAAVKHGVRRIVFASTSAVYPDDAPVPTDEGIRPDPGSPYGLSKLVGERCLEWFHRQHGLPYTALRYFNVYGPRQPWDGPDSGVIPAFIVRALRQEPLMIHGRGKQTRDFVFVEDVVAANLAALERHEVVGIFNVGAAGQTSVQEIAAEVLRLTGSPSTITFGPLPPGDTEVSEACIDRIAGALGWQPRTPLAEGLRVCAEWFSHSGGTRVWK
jgi:UDP-glucose 4-epimerase